MCYNYFLSFSHIVEIQNLSGEKIVMKIELQNTNQQNDKKNRRKIRIGGI